MKQEEIYFLEELADLYEEWAEEPPVSQYLTGETYEIFTCVALWEDYSEYFGYWDCPCDDLLKVWQEQYGVTTLPCGHTRDRARDSKRFDFCWYMAETLREAAGLE